MAGEQSARNGSANGRPNDEPAHISAARSARGREAARSDTARSDTAQAAHDERADLESLSLEDALQELDGIVAALEDGQLSLDESLTLYERGMRLIKRCQDALDTAELRVQRLRPATASDGGFARGAGFALESFETDED